MKVIFSPSPCRGHVATGPDRAATAREPSAKLVAAAKKEAGSVNYTVRSRTCNKKRFLPALAIFVS